MADRKFCPNSVLTEGQGSAPCLLGPPRGLSSGKVISALPERLSAASP